MKRNFLVWQLFPAGEQAKKSEILEGFGGLGRALTNPISRGRRPRSAIPTHCEMNLGRVNRMAQWAGRVKNFGTRVVVLGLGILQREERGARHESWAKLALVVCKLFYRNNLHDANYSTTAILLARERGSHRRPLASRAMLRTDELDAGIG